MSRSDSRPSTPSGLPVTDLIMVLLSGVLLAVGLYMVFYYAPLLKHNGLPWWSQKIFYIHLPVAWGSMSGFILVFIGSVAYIITRKESWDNFAVGAAEACLLFATLVLVTGPLWGKPSWNTYWKWDDPRLMSFFAMWLLLVAYQILRMYTEEGESKRLTSAAIGILGSISVPFVYLSVKFGNTLHPRPAKMQIGSKVQITTWVMLLAFFFVFLLFFRIRRRLEGQRNRLYRLNQLVSDLDE